MTDRIKKRLEMKIEGSIQVVYMEEVSSAKIYTIRVVNKELLKRKIFFSATFSVFGPVTKFKQQNTGNKIFGFSITKHLSQSIKILTTNIFALQSSGRVCNCIIVAALLCKLQIPLEQTELFESGF